MSGLTNLVATVAGNAVSNETYSDGAHEFGKNDFVASSNIQLSAKLAPAIAPSLDA